MPLKFYEGVVALHNPGVYSGFALILTWDKVCSSIFDVIYADNAAWGKVTVRDMQVFYNSAAAVNGTEVKLLVEASSGVFLVSGIVNDYKSGW